MKIKAEDVLKLAQIAHLSLTEEEVNIITEDLDMVVALEEQLKGLEFKEEGSKEPSLYNAFRKDEVKPSMAKEELLANAPQERNGCFFVPQIVE